MRIITPHLKHTLLHNFLGGLAWAVGITVGISILAYLLTIIATALGAIPLIGDWLAQIIKATLDALQKK